MYKKLLFVVAALLATGYVLQSHSATRQANLRQVNPTAAYDSFSHWKQHHKKMYSSEAQSEYRLGVFTQNLNEIMRLKEEYEAGKIDFTVDINQFADLSNAEFKARYLTLKRNKNARRNEVLTVNDPPAAFDWTTKNAVTPVKNQGSCGSCWAFSSTGSLEGLYAITKGQLLSFSEQQLVDCSSSYGNEGCNGGLMDQAFNYTSANGIELESSYPYTAVDGNCKFDASKVVFKNTAWTNVPASSESALRSAVYGQPVSVAVDAAGVAWQFYSGGTLSTYCGNQLDHGVLAVGYGTDSKSKTFWKVKNSWGSSWGSNGFIFLARDVNSTGPGKCGIQLDASYPTGIAA